MTLKQKLYTVWMFFVVNLKRLFRDRMALFFTFLFPLIFLFVFGSLFGNKTNDVSFNVAVINHSDSAFAKNFVKSLDNKKSVFKVNNDVKSLDQAKDKMSRSELDAAIVLPKDFGEIKDGHPSGQAVVRYTQNNQQSSSVLKTVLQGYFKEVNSKFVTQNPPFTVATKQINVHSLSQFDYTFTGLLGFAILGAGIFGPMNVFPELKKMGILRRLRTTPLRVWQFFLANMFGNAVTGLLSVAIMFVVAIALFHLHMVGNYLELAIFIIFGVISILGIGLAIGGWAKNERQAAPLGNIIVFPLMFLSGTFFPRFLMPDWLQAVTNYLPLTPIIDGARLIITEGTHLAGLGSQLLIMAVWTIIIYVIAFRVFRWE